QRLTLEAQAHSLDWERVNNTVQREVLEPGAIQFLDRPSLDPIGLDNLLGNPIGYKPGIPFFLLTPL
ncbi:MAG: hypothetical protein ACKO1W_11185, partial [Microcystaceae cyanobacterium]